MKMKTTFRITRLIRKAANGIHRAWRRHQVFIERGTPTSPVVQEETVCCHCGHVFRGNYCPRCGQNRNAGKGKPKFLKTFREAYPQLSNNFVRTMIQLVLRPGYMIRDYLRGHRVIYQSPISTFVIAISLFTLYTSIRNQVVQKDAPTQSVIKTAYHTIESKYATDAKKDKRMYAAYTKWKQKHNEKPQSRWGITFAIIKDKLANDTMLSLFFLFPVFGIISYLVFRKQPFYGRRLNIMEHYVFYTFLYSSVIVLFDDYILPSFLYTAWAYRGLYRLSWGRALWRTTLVMLISVLGLTIGVALLSAILMGQIVANYAM